MSNLKISQRQIKQIVKEELAMQQHRQKINEGVLDFLGDLFGSGADAMIDRVKNYIATWFLEALGFNTDSLFSQAVINVFENLSADEMMAIMSGDRARCPQIAREVLEAVGETMVEQLPELIGLDADGIFMGTVREMATNSIVRNNELIGRLADSLCQMDISNVFSGAGASEDSASAAEAALTESRIYKNQLTQIQYVSKRYKQLMNESKIAKKRRARTY